jgi:thiol-disulfide isomerase/thioredoxin
VRRGLLLVFLLHGLVAACASGSRAGRAQVAAPHAAYARVRASVDVRAGQPAVFVVFASWCGPCRRELGILAELRAAHPGLQVIGLNAYEDWADTSNETKLRAFLAESAPWLPVVHADAALLELLGGVPKIPSVFVFDGAGRLTHRFARHERLPPSYAELEAALGTVSRD